MGIAERKAREKEKRREEIIDAAEQVFFAKDFETATMEEIAESAELSKGTLYLYFKSKEYLFLAICERVGQKFLEDTSAASKPYKTGKEKFRAIMKAQLKWYQENPNYAKLFYQGRAMMRNLLKSDQHSVSEVIENALEADSKFIEVMQSAIELGIKDGSMAEVKDPMKYLLIMHIFQEGLIRFVNEAGEIIESLYPFKVEEIVEYGNDFLLK